MDAISLKQSPDLLRFIGSLELDADNSVVTNAVDSKISYVSKYFTPHLRVSPLTNKVLSMLDLDNMYANNVTLDEDNLTYMTLHSGLKTEMPDIYQLIQVIVADSFSMLYVLAGDTSLIVYLSSGNIQVTRNNIKYVIDALGTTDIYQDIVQQLTVLDTACGYLQAQVENLKTQYHRTGSIGTIPVTQSNGNVTYRLR